MALDESDFELFKSIRDELRAVHDALDRLTAATLAVGERAAAQVSGDPGGELFKTYQGWLDEICT